jgi:peptidoglycan/xylan/chitin deacetylase (PgdA/CDA1 family)
MVPFLGPKRKFRLNPCILPARCWWTLMVALIAAWLASPCAFAQLRSVAIAVDDLPYADGDLTPATASFPKPVNSKLLASFKKHQVPVTGFVIEERVQSLGASQGRAILRAWISGGFDLGNHSYSHSDINNLTLSEIEREILQGETTIAPLMESAGKQLRYFRFPMNHTGSPKERHDAIAAFLAEHRYLLAVCTIENSDYLFNAAYLRMLAKNDRAAAQKLRREYLSYTGAEIDYYAKLNKRVLDYEPPEVMLLHDNRLNADVIDQLLGLFEERQYRFVDLETAQSDPAYAIPDSFVTPYGPMWGYRWAQERNIKVNGKLEPELPQWILDYGRAAPK